MQFEAIDVYAGGRNIRCSEIKDNLDVSSSPTTNERLPALSAVGGLKTSAFLSNKESSNGVVLSGLVRCIAI